MTLVHCVVCGNNTLVNIHSNKIERSTAGITFKKDFHCPKCGYKLNEKIKVMLSGDKPITKRLENGQEILTK